MVSAQDDNSMIRKRYYLISLVFIILNNWLLYGTY